MSLHQEVIRPRDPSRDYLSVQREIPVPIAGDILRAAGLDSAITDGLIDPELKKAILAERREEREMRIGEWIDLSEVVEQQT